MRGKAIAPVTAPGVIGVSPKLSCLATRREDESDRGGGVSRTFATAAEAERGFVGADRSSLG
jgi:hypothetical protein